MEEEKKDDHGDADAPPSIHATDNRLLGALKGAKALRLARHLRASVSLWFTPLRAKLESLSVSLRHRFPRLDAAVTKAEILKTGLSQHLDVWREALKADRLRPKLGPVGLAELAFLPAALEVSETPASTTARAIAATLIAFFTATIAWASLGALDIVAAASGKVIPSGQVKVIQPLETSVVRAIRVAEGQAVRQGDVLIELEVTGGRADVERLTNDHLSALADMARLSALLQPDPPSAFRPAGLPEPLVEMARAQLAAQWAEHKAKLASLDSELAKKQAELRTTDADIARLTQMEGKIQDRTERRRILAEKGLGSEIERLRSEQEWEETHGNREVQRSKLTETLAAIESLKSQRDQAKGEFRRDATGKLAESRAKAASAEQELAKATDRQTVQTLRSPVDGTAQQLDVHTVGGVVQPAQKLLVVVPADSTLEIEARLPNKDIAFVEAGQEAQIKVEAFPFTRYGTLKGRVTTVSLDAVQDEQKKDYYFPIRVALEETSITVENGKRIPLTPGMAVTAEVKTGTRKPIEYVLAPLQRYKDESGRER
jgi:hemolysin D